MTTIHWYPGHMAKAKREMQARLSMADVAIEVLDARAPLATQNPDLETLFAKKPRVIVLNKEDLAQPQATKQWISYFQAQGMIAVPFCAVKSGAGASLRAGIEKAAAPIVSRWAQKGATKPVRVMITGIPNVGKSSVINALCGNKRTKVGATPGVTRGQQWVRITSHLELLDTPGILWPKLADEQGAQHLAFINAIRDEVLEPLSLALQLIATLQRRAPGALTTRYGLAEEQGSAQAVLEAIAKRRGCVVAGGELDTERAATLLIGEFRAGKLGRITLELPGQAAGKGDEQA